MRAVPDVLYAPTSAWLEMDGKHIEALPTIWESESDPNFNRALTERTGPVRVNKMPLDRTWMIAFPVRRPSPSQSYRVNAGPVTINGTEYATSTIQSCSQPSAWTWQPIVIH